MNATEKIDQLIAELDDWRGAMLANVRRIIHEADPEVVEEWKWRGAPVFSDHGIICVANAFKDKVKVTFYDGASLDDPYNVFNNGLDGNKWRTIDLAEGAKINEKALKSLIRTAVEINRAKGKPVVKASAKSSAKSTAKAAAKPATKAAAKTATKKKAAK